IPWLERSIVPLRSVVVAIASHGIQGCTTMAQFTVSEPESLVEGGVTLRPWQRDYASALAERINDRAVAEFMDMVPQPYLISDALEFIARSRDGWLTGVSTNF